MDIFARKKEREKKREEEHLKKLQEEEIFKKPEKSYVPSQKTMTLIAIVLILIAATYIYTTTRIVLKNDCTLFPGVICDNVKITQTSIGFDVHNLLKEDLNITIQVETCESMNGFLKPNTKATYIFNCTNKDPVKKQISISYAGYSGLWHEKKGKLQGMIA